MSGGDVLWHDIECGGYAEDFPLWRELADTHGGPVMDVGAGTGRVALDLARAGHDVVAVDLEAVLLEELARRAAAERLAVRTAATDATELAVDGPPAGFPLIIVPMQTVQLLGGPARRARFLARVRTLLAPGGVFAAALADTEETYDVGVEGEVWEIVPDMREVDGVVYASHPTAIRDLGDQIQLERLREAVTADGTRTATTDLINLDRIRPETLEAEGAAAGLAVLPRRGISMTPEYVPSTVVVLGG